MTKAIVNAFIVTLTCCIGLVFAQPTEKTERVLVLGDSISAGFGLQKKDTWPALLSAQLSKTHPNTTIINASISGETAAGGARRIDALLTKYKPTIVIVELGGNDGLRGQPLETIQKNLNHIIKRSQKANAKVLLVGMRLPPNYGKAYTEGFFDLYTTLAKKHNTELVPFFFETIIDQQNMFQGDRIHPTEKAQPHLKDIIWRSLMPMLAKTR